MLNGNGGGGMARQICSIDAVARSVREYEGVTRKHAIGEMIKSLKIDAPDVVASFGDDAAVIRHGDEALLLAADGIWSRLMEADPEWAGFCSVLVNIHDIAAMGGRPLALVDILSLSDDRIRDKVTRGMLSACEKFNVPIVGGHLHPDTPYSVIDVAILGIAKLDSVIYSHTAQAGDHVIAAVDLEGRVHPASPLNWDSVTMKSAEQVRAQIRVMQDLGEAHLVTAGKDISNPGILGTLGMLLEVSGKGAVIDLDDIPRPNLMHYNLSFEHWVRMYPGMGFILTAKKEHVAEVRRRFRKVGMTAATIGHVNGDRHLCIQYREEQASIFDLEKESIMGIDTWLSASFP